ncbi:restriction endonuclease subunit S [Serratia fonticola]|uniref:Restriction endonuclease subunit S n=1 Tax=Serratia fonticola TaxID=47917 RepID=A0ABY9PPJ8_SERFO|nr:restriction endonuclease subunit S [Serratia fonticola]WMT14899.1 restriction endonuclease subunit S [Serratia fonticola]
MNSELSRTELSCLITHKKGFAFKSKDYISSGVPVVRVSNFTWDSISTDDLRYVSHEVAINNKVVQLNEDDVIVATVGSWPQNPASIVGKVVKVPRELSGALLNQNTVRLRVIDENPINQKYLYIALKTKEFSDNLISKAQGSANQASITLSDIFSYAIPWGTYPQRKYIVDVIDSINSKTVIANQINKTLEQMAQTLFKSWFVDFEPVKAKAAVLQAGGSQEEATLAAMMAISAKDADALAVFEREHPEQYAELKATAEQFPSAMQDSELGDIPEGWRVGDLSNVASLNAESWSKKNAPESISYVDLANTKWGVINSIETYQFSDAPSRAKRILKPHDTIVGTVRPGNGSYAYINKTGLTGSTGFAVLTPKNRIFSEYIYLCVTSNESIERLAHLADGGAYPAVNADVVLSTQCVLPVERETIEALLKMFSSRTEVFFSYRAKNLDQNEVLTSTRDTLLPKLLSGEITLPEAEQAVSEVENV